MGLFKDLRGLTTQVKALDDQTKAARPGFAQRLSAAGVRGSATVINTRPTQMRMNEMPVIEIDLRMAEPHGGTEVTVRQAVHELYLARLVPEASVMVTTDPENAETTQVVWD